MEKMMYQFNGLEKAVVGLATQALGEPLLVYDYNKIVDIFIDGGMNEDEAREYTEYNVLNLNLGERTPLIITPCDYEEALELIGGESLGAVQ
jgi:hypothetical protein